MEFEKLLFPVLKAVLTLAVGHIFILYLKKILKKALSNVKWDKSLVSFVIKAVSIILYIIIILSVLSSLGISTSGFIAALSAVGVALAVGLKDSLNNVAGGILLLISPSFATGDYIKTDNDEGTVLKVDLLHTTIKTADNKLVTIPNGLLINSHIINYTSEPQRRVDIIFNLPYEADIEKAKGIILKVIEEHDKVIDTPQKPIVRVLGYGDSAVNVVTRSWCVNSDYWDVYFDLTEQIRKELENNNIYIPYNKLEVIVDKNKD